MASKEEIERGANEILLWIDSERPTYERKIAMFENLAKKKKKGTYDHKLAPKMFLMLTTDTGRKWNKKFARDHGKITTDSYRLAAKEMTKEFESAYRNKEYDFMK